MRRFSLFVCCFYSFIFSAFANPTDQIPLTEVEGDPSTIVAGCVNAITGNYGDSAMDLFIPGPEPLVFRRFYSSADWEGGSLCDGWNHSYSWKGLFGIVTGYFVTRLPEASGGSMTYVSTYPAPRDRYGAHYYPRNLFPFDTNDWNYQDGLTNTGTGEISGRLNLKNQSMVFDPCGGRHRKGASWNVALCDGGSRTFKLLGSSYLPATLQLLTETRPNGNQIHYEYQDNELVKIKTTDPTGQHVFGWLTFSRSDYEVNITASDGRKVNYWMHKSRHRTEAPKWRRYVQNANRPEGPKETYAYCANNHKTPERITKKSLPDGRFQAIDYYLEGGNWVGDTFVKIKKWEKGDIRGGKVKTLSGPVGIDSTALITHRFFYDYQMIYPDMKYSGGSTDSRDAYNHRVIYRHMGGDRLTHLERWLGNSDATYRKYSTERFYWGIKERQQHTDLICKALEDDNGVVRSCRYLEYDNKHNIIAAHICGNLSGTNSVTPVLNGEGVPQENGCERYITRYTYSNDNYNLRLSETLPNGRVTTFEYKPNSDLLVAKLISDGSHVVAREFHEYDHFSTCVKIIVDDGSGQNVEDLTGVTTRRMTIITPKAQTPCLGLPEVIEQRYYDPTTGLEYSLGRQVNTYSVEGRITQQDHFDANGTFSHRLIREYDSMGNIILEQNALGQLIQRRFDDNGNKVYEIGPSRDFHAEYTYDYSNRLIAEELVCADGQRFKQSYRYDYLGNRVGSVDVFGNETSYLYDDLGRLVTTIMPPCLDKQGHIVRLQAHQEYDIAGNIISNTDLDGNITCKKYNIRGQPTFVQHPDGTCEYLKYHPDGTLDSHTSVNGTTVICHYDVFGNVVRRETFSEAGELQSVTTATYRGALLISETDANGSSTFYHYDGAGRLIQIDKASSRSKIEYDALGRKQKTIEWINADLNEARVTLVEYDLLDRVIEERVEDALGQLYSKKMIQYDVVGNPSAVIVFTDLGPSVTQTLFNAQGRPWKIIDQHGHETITHYDYSHINAQGQRVLQITAVDPLGNQLLMTQDTLGRVVSTIRKDNLGVVTAQTDSCYDGHSRLVKRMDTIKALALPDREVITEWQYDSIGRVVGLFEAVGTPQSRQTLFSYNNYGQKDKDLLSDGVIIDYKYDSLGRLHHYSSSDGSVGYTFTYDGNGNILTVYDEIRGSTNTRVYDSNNRVVEETLSNGLNIGYQYDSLDRNTAVRLPDASRVLYTYDAAHLKTVTRLASDGTEKYSHSYLTRDLCGKVTSAQMIQNAGQVTFEWNKLQQQQHLKTVHFEEEVPEGGYDAVGNLKEKSRRDVFGTIKCHYAFDALYQLVSEDGLASHRYGYDSLNNRLLKNDETCEVNVLNQLVRQGEKRYGYDARGNRVQHKGRQLTYDALGRLVEVEALGRRFVYAYDSFNRRISKTIYEKPRNETEWQKASEERYLYQGQMEVGMVDEQGALIQFRTLGEGLGAEIGSAIALELEDKLYAPLHDQAGHVVALLEPGTGNPFEVYQYTAFGEVTCHTRNWRDEWILRDVPTLNPWRFASKRCDPETGFVHFGRRHFDSETGRWLTPDPKGYEDGPNLYAYVHNSPLTHIDYYGLYTASTRENHNRSNRWSLSHSLRSLSDRISRAWRKSTTRMRDRAIQRNENRQNRPRPSGVVYCGWFESIYSWHEPSDNYHVGDPDNSELSIGFTNGMHNDKPDSKGHSHHLSILGGGCRVKGTYNATKGLLGDLIECFIGLFRVATAPVAKLHQKWNTFVHKKPDGQHVEFCTSQGTIHVRNALMAYPSELRKRISVVAIAPAVYIDPSLCGDVFHYRATWYRDLIPRLFDWFGAWRARKTITTVDCHPDAPYFDHSFSSPTYEPYIERHLRTFQQSGGQRI